MRDDALRAALQANDEHLTALDAVRIFGTTEILGFEKLHDANDAQRLAALDSVIAWWSFAGRLVFERLEATESGPCGAESP